MWRSWAIWSINEGQKISLKNHTRYIISGCICYELHAWTSFYAQVNLILLRDLKPENIIYDERTKIVKLIDLSSATFF